MKENKTVPELMGKKLLRGEPSQAMLKAMGVHDEGNKQTASKNAATKC